eukprot:TRINITY_DN3001_c0_g1_i5.p1 TRINITY_DN3001_c0_g1~~TRINITY_DN3001_c0_g1_i5.p1  ORF type:complete len:355 (+),score=27.33 TRINITY_DN3001_c0_g1_i5:49-1065(+)
MALDVCSAPACLSGAARSAYCQGTLRTHRRSFQRRRQRHLLRLRAGLVAPRCDDASECQEVTDVGSSDDATNRQQSAETDACKLHVELGGDSSSCSGRDFNATSAWEPIWLDVNFWGSWQSAVPASILAEQCQATRIIQRAWRHSREDRQRSSAYRRHGERCSLAFDFRCLPRAAFETLWGRFPSDQWWRSMSLCSGPCIERDWCIFDRLDFAYVIPAIVEINAPLLTSDSRESSPDQCDYRSPCEELQWILIALDPYDKLDDETSFSMIQDMVRWLHGRATLAGRSYRNEWREYKRIFCFDDDAAANKLKYASTCSLSDWKRQREAERLAVDKTAGQ